MANQMIALQARAPQSSGLGGAIAQNAQMINMMMQQNAAQRQAAQAQQKMDIEAQLAGPQLAKARSEAQAAQVKVFKDFMMASTFGIANARNANDAVKIGEILKTEFNDPIFTNIVDQTLASIPEDPAQFGTWKDNTLLQSEDAIKQLEMKYPKPKSELAIGVGGQPYVVNTGGLEAPTIVKPRSLVPGPQATPTQTQPRTGQVEVEPSTVVDGAGGPYTNNTLDMLDGIISAQNDRDYQSALALVERANPDMVAALRRAMPHYDPSRIKGIRAEFSRAFGGADATDIPLVAGPRGGPYEGYVEAPLDVRLKDPTQAPVPGVYDVPTGRVSSTAGAQAGGSKSAELRAERENDYPDATARMRATFQRLDNIIETARDLKRHPAYRRIIGPLDAITPNVTGGAVAAQSLFKTLTDMGAIDELQKMRGESKTGGAVGNASDADIKLLANAFGALDQRQDESDFDTSLTAVINRAMQTRQRVADQYRDTYKYRLPKNWNPPPIARTRPQPPQGKGTKVGDFIVTEVQ